MRLVRRSTIGGAVVLVSALLGVTVPAGAASARHERTVSFWTHDRVARAVPRDFAYNPASGRFERAGKPGGGGSSSGSVGGASWTQGGLVVKTTGKVLFAMGGSYYVCSASVATDPGTAGRSVVLTAGHCAYDETTGQPATNWMFVPAYDSAPAPLTSSGSFCADTVYGCWSADALIVRREWASAGGFTSAAVPYDFAFAVLGNGGLSGAAELDQVVGSQAIGFTADIVGSRAEAFGYPASGKYHGNDLTYCAGTVGTDSRVAHTTYRLGCDMTGGSSGGPWFSQFSSGTGAGTLSSVNSYGYSGVKAMFGPKLNASAQSLYDVARTATTNTVV